MKEEQLRTLVAEVVEADPAAINSDTDLRALPGFDSVNVLALMIALDEQMGIKLGPEQASQLRFMRELEELARGQGKL
jgi:acyl carrier protein